MPKAVRAMFQNVDSYDETDRIPRNITITNLDLLMYVVAIVGHLVDLGLDINIAARYYMMNKVIEFCWTLTFILLPAFVNTAVSIRMILWYFVDLGSDWNLVIQYYILGRMTEFWCTLTFIILPALAITAISMRMYSQDRQQNSLSNAFTKRQYLRIVILVLQLAPVLRFCDAFIYAIRSRRAERQGNADVQRSNYHLMLKEDSDAALLRIFECFLEAAPQQVLQMSLRFREHEDLALHQTLSIMSSMASLGWCLAAYQRAIRFPQEDKLNMSLTGSILQTIWHFLVTMSRIVSLSMIAYMFPQWTIMACACHIVIMATYLQIYDRSHFCPQNSIAEIAFSFALGAVYLFEYILPNESRTRYRYIGFYSLCFVQNCVCACLWYVYADDVIRMSMYYYPILICSVVPFVIGIWFMVVYYAFFHPKVRMGNDRVANVNNVNFEIA